MTRTDLACCCLIASACILGGLILHQLPEHVSPNEARAEMVDSAGGMTKLTTRFETDSELLYLLDGQRGVLVAYEVDPRRGNMDLVGRLNLSHVFDLEADVDDLEDLQNDR